MYEEKAVALAKKYEAQRIADNAKYASFSQQDWDDFDKLVLYQKLQNIMADLGKDTVLNSLWKDASVSDRKGALKKFDVGFDLEAEKIRVSTKARDNDGKPLYQWDLDGKEG